MYLGENQEKKQKKEISAKKNRISAYINLNVEKLTKLQPWFQL